MSARHIARPSGAHTGHPGSARPYRARHALHSQGSAGRIVAAGLVTTMAATVLVTPSAAAWLAQEFDYASVGVIDCATTTAYESTASGRFLSANLVGVPLPTIAAIDDVQVTVVDGQPDQVSPAGATPLGNHAYSNPLSVSVLNDALTADLSGLLLLPLDTSTGVLNQYAQALTSGDSTGAAGAILDSGAVNLEPTLTGPQAPSIATLSLENVITSVLGTGGAGFVGEVTALDLQLGAVAGIATLDACVADYADTLVGSLVRDYLIASLALQLDSPLVGDLTTAVSIAVTGLETQLNSLTDEQSPGLVTGITSGLTTLLGSLLTDLQIGAIDVALTANWDFSAVTALLDDTISDAGGLVEIDLATGLVSVNLAALVDPVNGLNGAAPNTEVLINATMITQLENAISSALGAWAADVGTALDAALDAITLSGSVTIMLQTLGLDVAQVGLTLTGASLASLITNSETPPAAVITVDALGLIECPPNIITNPVGYAVSVIVCPLLDTLTTTLTGGLQGVVGTAVMDLLTAITTDLGANLDTLTDVTTSPLVELLSLLTSGLLGVDGVASLLINVQNDPLTGNPEPGDWAAIPNGQYDVAALRLGVLGLLGTGQDVDVVLATGSVGPNTRTP